MQIASEKAPEGAMALVVIRKKQSNAGVQYTIADTWLPKLAEWNRTLDTRGRYHVVMKAKGLFEVMQIK